MEQDKLTLTNIESREFGLTQEDVFRALGEARASVIGYKGMQKDPNKKLADMAKRALPGAEFKAQALSAPVDQVLATCRGFYDRTIELAHTGLDENEIALKMCEEFSSLTNYYGLLRMMPWGYHLGQLVMAARVNKQLKNS